MEAELRRWVIATREEPDRLPVLEELRARRVRIPGPDLHVVANDEIAAPHPVPIRRYEHSNSKNQPTVVYVHGGGFVSGDLDSHDRACRRLASLGGVDVVSVDYRLAPEHPAPAAINDVIAVLAAIRTERGSTAVGMAGDSAGGLVAYLASHQATAEGRAVDGLLLLNPNVDPKLEAKSVHSEGRGWGLDERALRWFIQKWLPASCDRDNLAYRPLLLPAGKMPLTTVVTSEHDPLRDEGNALAAHLQAAGRLRCHLQLSEMVHGFINLDTISPAAKSAGDQILEDFAHFLRRQTADDH